MSAESAIPDRSEYKYGFVTDVESDAFPKGLDESVVRRLGSVKEEPAFEGIDTRVTVLHEGSVLAEGSIDTVQDNQRVIEVYLGR